MMRTVRVAALALPLVMASACAHQDRTGAMGSGQQASAAGATDPMMQPGPAVQGHAGDRVVVGRVASAGQDSVSISTDSGDTRTLRIVPETTVQLNGQDVSGAELQEGLPVRASFDQVSGEDVAVQVWAGTPPAGAGSTGSMGSTGSTGSSTPGYDGPSMPPPAEPGQPPAEPKQQ